MFRLILILSIIIGVTFAAPTQQNGTSSSLGIIGGQDADIKNYPWTVSLQFFSQLTCGAFLISNKWAVTAAHCIQVGYYAQYLTVSVGSTNYRNGQSVSVKRYIIHPQFNVGGTKNNDIALLELDPPVTLGTSVRAASLPVAGQDIPDNTTVTILGWGATKVNGPGSSILQAVSVPTVNLSTCQSAYSQYSLTDNMFCAGLLEVGGKDACQGDSGGPVVINKQVVGIVSWGLGCAEPHQPGVYTRVSSFIDWISENAGI